MPAAAVIPAPIAYIKFVAVRRLVVEICACPIGPASLRTDWMRALSGFTAVVLDWAVVVARDDYFEQIRVFKAGGNAVNTLAWNNV